MNFQAHPPTAFQTPLTERIDFNRLWNIFFKRRWSILTMTSIAFSLAVIYIVVQPNIYTSTVSILVQPVDKSPLKYEELVMPEIDRITYYRTQMRLITSRNILEETVKNLDLKRHFNKGQKRPLPEQKILEKLKKKITVRLIPGTQIILVSVVDRNAGLSTQIANFIAENFVKESLRDRLFISDQLLKWFPEEAGQLKRNSPIEQIRELDQADIVSTLPTVVNDPVLKQIKQERIRLEAEIKELSRRYTAEHPKMEELLEKSRYLNSEYRAVAQKIIRGLKAGLMGAFNVTNIKIAEPAMVPLEASGPRRGLFIFLVTWAAFSMSGFIVFFIDFIDQRIRTDEDLKNIPMPFLGYSSIISELQSESEIKKTPFSSVSFPFWLPKFQPAAQVDTMKPLEEEGKLLNYIKTHSSLPDEIRNIRSSILFSLPKNKEKLMMVTSALPGEGKTTVSLLLGLSMAFIGEKVLVIDADLRRSSVHRYLALPNEVGLTHCLTGVAAPRDAIQTVEEHPNLHVMPAGESSPNPDFLLTSQAFDRLLEELVSQYDRILFDVPPILLMSDGLIVARKVQGVIAVLGYGMTHIKAARKIKESLEAAQTPLIGAIINKVSLKDLNLGYGHNYYNYYNQYRKYYAREKSQTALPVND